MSDDIDWACGGTSVDGADYMQTKLYQALARITELEAECARLTGIVKSDMHGALDAVTAWTRVTEIEADCAQLTQAYHGAFKALTASQKEADALLVERDRLSMELLARPAMVAPVPVRNPIHAAIGRHRTVGLRAPEGMG
jgi:hypothetical protein